MANLLFTLPLNLPTLKFSIFQLWINNPTTVGRVNRRLGTPRVFSAAKLKKFLFNFWVPLIKNFIPISKITLFLVLGLLETWQAF